MGKILLRLGVLLLCSLLTACGIAPVFPDSSQAENTVPAATPREVAETPVPTTPEPTPTPPPQTATPSPTPTPWPLPVGAFTAEDLQVEELRALATYDQVIQSLGEPDFSEEITEQVTGVVYQSLVYDSMVLQLLDGKILTGVTLLDDDYAGPRGIEVGDRLKRVLQVFVRDEERIDQILDQVESGEDEDILLYGNPLGEDGYSPPCGVIHAVADENGEIIVRFIDTSRTYTDEERKSGAYLLDPHAGLLFYVDQSRLRVTRIYWYYQPLG